VRPPAGFWTRARRNPSFVLGAVVSTLFAAAALLSLVWTPWPAAEIDIPNRLATPSAAHWLGTDSLGRDIASQLLVGARTSILVGVVAVLIGLGVGLALGALASARRGWVEEAVMRLSDFTFAFPALLSAIMLGAIYGPSPSASSTSRCSRAPRVPPRMRCGRANTCSPHAPPARGRGASRSTMCCPTLPAS
jgi:peptide/nickel transport system permease protein